MDATRIFLLLLIGCLGSFIGKNCYANCQNHFCVYEITLDRAGFYIATVQLPVAGKAGMWGLTIDLGNNLPATGFNTGGLLRENGLNTHFLGFYLNQEATLRLNTYEYTQKVAEWHLRLRSANQENEIIYSTLAVNDASFLTPLLEKGFYIAEMNNLPSSAAGIVGLSLSGGSFAASINSGGWLEKEEQGFVAFYADSPRSVRLVLFFAESFGASGATQPVLSVLSQALDSNNQQIYWQSAVVENKQISSIGLVSQSSSSGVFGNATSKLGDVSADGQFLVFESFASNLLPTTTDTNLFAADIFLLDRTNRVLTRIASEGAEPRISADGRFIVFSSLTQMVTTQNNLTTTAHRQIYLYDRLAATFEQISVTNEGSAANADCGEADVSGDGRWVVFSSDATNLVTEETNGLTNVFLYDRQTRRITLISKGLQEKFANGDSFSPAISDNGQVIAFVSDATNVAEKDINTILGAWDIVVHDRINAVNTIASVSSEGKGALDRSQSPALSADGQFIVFASLAENLVANDTNKLTGNGWDIFIHDRQSRQTQRLSVSATGLQGGDSFQSPPPAPSISADGRYIVFPSSAKTLGSYDQMIWRDIFIKDRITGYIQRVSTGLDGVEANGDSLTASISANGRFIVFDSFASNLVKGDINNVQDIFIAEYLSR